MVGAIPISSIVRVTPSVVAPAPGVSTLLSAILTQNTAIAAAGLSPATFTSLTAVGTTFGTGSVEYEMASVIFTGYTNCTSTAGQVTFIYFPEPVAPATVASQMSIARAATPFSGFSTAYEPTAADLLSFANWTASQNNLVMFVGWDTAPAAVLANQSGLFGQIVKAQSLSGVAAVYSDPMAAALVLAVMSSLDFSATAGRQTLAGRANALIVPVVTDGTSAANLLVNGYNFYGAYAEGSQNWQFFEDGHIGGTFAWIDSFICQMWLNQSFRIDLVNLLLSLGQIPFNIEGDTLIEAALQDTISQGLTFGAIQSGVTLSATEAAQVNAAAGKAIDSVLSTRGWYLKPGASTATPSVRVARGPISAVFWYTDGQSVQSINLSSVEVQ